MPRLIWVFAERQSFCWLCHYGWYKMPCHDKTCLYHICEHQPAHPHSLISIFVVYWLDSIISPEPLLVAYVIMIFTFDREDLAKPASNLYLHNLTGILETAIRATNAQFDHSDILKRLDVRLLEVNKIIPLVTSFRSMFYHHAMKHLHTHLINV